MYLSLLAVLVLVLSTEPVMAACEIDSIQKFYRHVREVGPLRKAIESKKLAVRSEIGVAEQRPNPEIDLEYLRGDQFGLDVNTYTLSARHVFEYGSKRAKRLAKANSLSEMAKLDLDLKLLNSNFRALMNYQRSAQLKLIIDSVREAIQAFNSIVKKLASRESLNPEERVSLSTLKLASNDYQAQLNDLENELSELNVQLEFQSGCSGLRPNYEYFRFSNLKLDPKRSSESGLVKLEDLKVELAASDVEVQRSLGYSNILVGPMIEYQNLGDDEFVSAGVALTFALPLFQTNDGGKAQALAQLSAKKLEARNKKNLLRLEKANLTQQYARSLKTYKSMPSLNQLKGKHRQLEKLFARGLVSIPMTIESHRQQVDFLKSRFETENDLLTSYLRLKQIVGNNDSLEDLFSKRKSL